MSNGFKPVEANQSALNPNSLPLLKGHVPPVPMIHRPQSSAPPKRNSGLVVKMSAADRQTAYVGDSLPIHLYPKGLLKYSVAQGPLESDFRCVPGGNDGRKDHPKRLLNNAPREFAGMHPPGGSFSHISQSLAEEQWIEDAHPVRSKGIASFIAETSNAEDWCVQKTESREGTTPGTEKKENLVRLSNSRAKVVARAAENPKAESTLRLSEKFKGHYRVKQGGQSGEKGMFVPAYQGHALTQLRQRPPRRRAVVVGINYVFSPDILLRGCCNDATVVALELVNLCDFKPEDVILLVDSYPSACYRSPHFDERDDEAADGVVLWKDRQPTRRNVLLALNWLQSDTMPGDVLFFFFAGHGIQIDNMSGWEGEGYDEAILPMDFFGEEVNALTAVMIRNLLLSVSNDAQVTVILDCTGGQTMLDPAGTGSWKFIKGIKQKGVWPFVTDATDKVARATYDPLAWTDESMRRRGARPRFVPQVDVSSTQDLLDPTLQRVRCMRYNYLPFSLSQSLISRLTQPPIKLKAWGQCAIEARMPTLLVCPITRQCEVLADCPVTMLQGKRYAYHGVFSWAFLTALKELLTQATSTSGIKAVSYKKLMQEIDAKIRFLKSRDGGLCRLNQHPELTFYRSGNSDSSDLFLWPFGGKRKSASYSHDGGSISMLPCVPHETRYLSPWEAEEELHRLGRQRRENDPALRRAQTRQPSVNPWKRKYQFEGGSEFPNSDQTATTDCSPSPSYDEKSITKVAELVPSDRILKKDIIVTDTIRPHDGNEKPLNDVKLKRNNQAASQQHLPQFLHAQPSNTQKRFETNDKNGEGHHHHATTIPPQSPSQQVIAFQNKYQVKFLPAVHRTVTLPRIGADNNISTISPRKITRAVTDKITSGISRLTRTNPLAQHAINMTHAPLLKGMQRSIVVPSTTPRRIPSLSKADGPCRETQTQRIGSTAAYQFYS